MNKEQNNDIDRLPRVDKNIGSRNDEKKKRNKWLRPVLASILAIALIGGALTFKLTATKAEQNTGTPESGATSRILSLYNAIVALGATYGSDAAGAWGDWGAKWNRIYSAATWPPAANSAVTDVKTSKTFYSNSRTIQTGTYPASGPCSTQQYDAF